MSYVQSNLSYEPQTHGYTEEEVQGMTASVFYDLPLNDAIYIYNNYPNEYARLTGKETKPTDSITTADTAKQSRATTRATQARDFATEFEKVVDDAFIRVCGHRAGEL